MKRATFVLFTVSLLAGLLVAGPAHAQSAGGTEWSRLTPTQRSVLAPLQDHWETFGGEQRQRWLQFAARYPKMSPDEQQRVQERMAEWSQITPNERGRARAQFQQSRTVDRSDLQARWEAYQALPPEQRQKLAEQAEPPPRARPERRRDLAARDDDGVDMKSNIVRAPRTSAEPRQVSPTIVQPGPGATTTLIGQPASPPAHQQPGLPKLAANPGFVDPNTLLPQRGPQAAGARSARGVRTDNDR